MKKIYSIILITALLFSVNACNRTGDKQSSSTEEAAPAIGYLSVTDIFEQGESLANKTVLVEGIVEHVCKHTWKRFKIVDEGGKQDLKIELGDQFPSIDASILGKKAKVTYVEKHFAMGEGKGRRTLNPTTKVFLDEGATAEMELTQIGGVDEADRLNEATLGPGSLLLITERVLTEGEQSAVSTNNIILQGFGSRANMISRSVMKGNSKQIFHANMEARNKCFGHIECDAIIMDNGTNETMPALKALHPDAELTHEASIGKIANDQLTKLMSLGLTYDEAVNRIIQGFLK